MKVLIVDDDPTIVTTISELLTEMGHEPVGITRGSSIASWLNSRHFDLVLMDIQMPDSDGVLMISGVTQSGCKAVVMSGLPEELWVPRAMMDGAFDCLPKPISLKKLAGILQRIEAGASS